jgi:hypothetical protein
MYDTVPKHDDVILMGDFNAKIGKNISNQEMAGKCTVHDVTNGDGKN